ncbi:hypothetical protein WICPIJ_007176 [Wickerhamomyces pijperi]|uniref:AN1-type domain-containing protein n=1 Tax=Wickerhamomyces pijperi TaxID=599730 RepID=A0A9P8Q2A3_WICPI|nr:hypothetical protein WICPIJ_007176 [Wickerhamomyces pijperi]
MSKTELMEIGEHCSFCGQIDFLPFKCSCKQTFCLLHKNPESHQCPTLKQQPSSASKSRDGTTSNSFKDLPSSQSLFPDRSKPIEIKFKTTETHPVTIQDSSSSKKSSSALEKLKRLFVSTNSQGKSKPKQTLNNSTKKLIAVSKLKSSAKGDPKVPVTERIYITVQILKDDDKGSNSEASVMKHPLFVSRAWPVGRALDSIADILKVKNVNNRTTDTNEKLFLFKLKGFKATTGEPDLIKIETGERVIKALGDGDEVYLVRGTDV